MECKYCGWGQINCGYFEDVGVKCKNDSVLVLLVVVLNSKFFQSFEIVLNYF